MITITTSVCSAEERKAILSEWKDFPSKDLIYLDAKEKNTRSILLTLGYTDAQLDEYHSLLYMMPMESQIEYDKNGKPALVTKRSLIFSLGSYSGCDYGLAGKDFHLDFVSAQSLLTLPNPWKFSFASECKPGGCRRDNWYKDYCAFCHGNIRDFNVLKKYIGTREGFGIFLLKRQNVDPVKIILYCESVPFDTTNAMHLELACKTMEKR